MHVRKDTPDFDVEGEVELNAIDIFWIASRDVEPWNPNGSI